MRVITILFILLIATPAWAQSDSFGVIPSVQSASKIFHDQVTGGGSSVVWKGLGVVSGDMVDMELTNGTDTTEEYRFVPGMLLQDASHLVQPILLEESMTFSLEPGETIKRRMSGYCLDYTKAAPILGSYENYEIDPTLGGYEQAVEALYNGIFLYRERKFKPVLRPSVHRTIVIQRAIWAVLGGKNPSTEEDLKEDLEDEVMLKSFIFPSGQVDCLAKRIWSDVQKVLSE